MQNRDRLIQEDYIDTEHGPWKVLVICQCLNRSTWMVAEGVVQRLFEKFPNPKSMTKADPMDIYSIVRPLGLGDRRTDSLIDMSKQFMIQAAKYTRYESYDILGMSGCGVYALDAWKLFVLKKSCVPLDKQLKRYSEQMGVTAWTE